MSVILRNIQIPLFIKIEPGILPNIRKILDEHHLHFQKPIIISEEMILELGGNDVVNALGDPATVLTADNSTAQGDKIAKEIREKGNDIIVSIGGGRVLDLGKYVATKTQTNYISIPTTPSNDGICSPVAVLKNDEGRTESMPVNMPVGVLVDTQMLTSAPAKNIHAGIGDLISNFSAIDDWRLAYEDGKDSMDDFAASMAYSAAQLIYETCRGVKIDLHDEAFLGKLTHGLILSGIAMNIAGSSRPASGAEHKISHAMDLLYPGKSLHGLQVAFGTLLATFLRDEPIDHMIDFFRSVSLPISYDEMGYTEEEMVNVLTHASETRAERYTIIEKIGFTEKNAREYLDKYHEYIKQFQ